MLFYDPPFLLVEDIVVFRDHADAEAFYWLRAVPRLAREPDGEPAFSASVFLPPSDLAAADPQAVTRTTLSFDTELSMDGATEEGVRLAIEEEWGRRPKILTPVPTSGGQTRLTLAMPVQAEDNPEVFVHQGHAPSLVAANRAAFAVAAEGAEARLLAAGLLRGDPAAVVSYELEYPGLAPSFKASMRVHWDLVYAKLQERSSRSYVVVSDEIEATVESLEDGKEIELDIRELSEEGAGEATKALLHQLREEIMKKLFETPIQMGEVPVEERIARGVRGIVSSLIGGIHHLRRQIDSTALSTTTVDLREQRVRTYTFYPQSTLAGLLAAVPDLRQRISFVDMGLLPGRVETLRIGLMEGSDSYAVRMVEVLLEVRTPPDGALILERTLHLRPGDAERTVSFRRPGLGEPEATFRLIMHLDPERSPSGRETVVFPPRPVVGGRIWIQPTEWLDLATLRVVIDDLTMFAIPTEVDVEVEALPAPADEPRRIARLTLSSERPEAQHSVVVDEGSRVTFRVREIIRRRGEADHFVEAQGIAPGTYRVMNHTSQSFQMRLRAMADWDRTATLFAELRVWDVERRTFLRDEHSFTAEQRQFILAFSTSPSTPRRAEVRLTRLGTDGSLVKGPWQDLVGPVAVIDDGVEAERRIRTVLEAPGYRQLNPKKVWVELEYAAPSVGLDLATKLTFSGDGDVQDWTHPFPDPTQERFRYRLRARSRSGLRWDAPWTETALDTLRLALPEEPFDE